MKKSTKQRAGFTLIELLTVIVVIAILAGLIYPSYNAVRQRSWDTTTRDLCTQAVAGWTSVLLENRYLPPADLIDGTGGATSIGDGDYQVVMNTEACSLLNWWKPRSPIPSKDVAAYNKWIKDSDIKFHASDYGFTDDSERPNDLVLERTSDQLKWGLTAPWVKKFLASADRDALTSEQKEKINLATVRVLLDHNGDGKLNVPEEVVEALNLTEEESVVNKAVAAWAYSNEEKKKIITSW